MCVRTIISMRVLFYVKKRQVSLKVMGPDIESGAKSAKWAQFDAKMIIKTSVNNCSWWCVVWSGALLFRAGDSPDALYC